MLQIHLCCETFDFSLVIKSLCLTVPAPPGPPLSKSMSQMSSFAEFFSFFFLFLEESSGGFSRDSSSDLLMSEDAQKGDSVERSGGIRKEKVFEF